VSLATGASTALSQIDNLPRLGDAAAEELSPAAERRLGEAIMREVRRDASVSDDLEVNDYLNRLGSTLTGTSAASGYSFELFLVLDTTLNAFALPGGFIGVHSGLVVASQNFSSDVITYIMVIGIIGLVVLMPAAGELGRRFKSLDSESVHEAS